MATEKKSSGPDERDFECKEGFLAAQTIERKHMDVIKAKQYAKQLKDCIGFCIFKNNQKPPNEKSGEIHLCHFKKGTPKVTQNEYWYSYRHTQSTARTKTEEQKQIAKPAKKDPKIALPMNTKLGKLLQDLPKEGKIALEKANNFWKIQLGQEWQDAREEFPALTDDLYSNERWYKEGIERGKDWADKVKEKDPIIKTVPPTSLGGSHVTLGRFAMDDEKKPACFVDGNTVKFKIARKELVCYPPFRSLPKNLPGQEIEKESGYRFYATHWYSLEIEFLDFDYKTRFPPHISLCNIAVRLKADDVDVLDKANSNY